MHHHNTQKGFIALITTIILSVVILTIVVTVGFSTFFGRFAILDSEVNERSSALAEACVETAILKLAQNDEYFGAQYVRVGENGGCHICQIEGGDTVYIQASSTDAFTNLEVVVADLTTGEIDTWEELPSITVDHSDNTCDIP